MPAITPVKANMTGGAVTSLGEAAAGDFIAISNGGTGATTASAALTNLGAASLDQTTLDQIAASFSSGTLTLNLGGRRAAIFTHTSTASITSVVLTGAPATGDAMFLLRLTNGGAYTYTHPGNSQAAGGVTSGIGALTSSGVDELLYRRNQDGSRVVVSVRKDVKA